MMAQLVTRADVARLLHVTRRTVDIWVERSKAGKMDHIFPWHVDIINGAYRYKKTEILKWAKKTGRLTDQ